MTSHYTWGSMTTLHDFGGVFGRPLNTFLWALTISWSRLLARGWSGPQFNWSMNLKFIKTSRKHQSLKGHIRNILQINKEKAERPSHVCRLDLETQGFRPFMPQKSTGHWNFQPSLSWRGGIITYIRTYLSFIRHKKSWINMHHGGCWFWFICH